MGNTSVTCPSCGSQVSVREASGTKIVKCPGCKNELEVDFSETGSVGAGVPSFQRAKPGEQTAGGLSREEREFLETGGLGDLLFNPMEGMGRAFRGLGGGVSMLISVLIFAGSIASVWYLFFKGIASRYDSEVGDVLEFVPMSNHLSFIFVLFLIPLTLYLLLQLLALVSDTTCSPWEIFSATAIIFIPWTAILGITALTILLPPVRDFLAIPFAVIQEFSQSGFSTVPETMNFASWMMLIGIATLAVTLFVHPLLLTFSALTNTVGMSHQAAFFVTPFVPTLHFVLLIAINSLIGGIDFLQFDGIRDLAS